MCGLLQAAASALALAWSATACVTTPGLCYTGSAGDPRCDEMGSTSEVASSGETTGETTAGETTDGTIGATSEATTDPGPVCGDGVVEEGEACDDGDDDSTDICTNACELATCGDGIVWAGMEGCDDGNDVAGDGCHMCVLETCGDGALDEDEGCDDGNDVAGDGCEDNCTPTPGVRQVVAASTHTCAVLWTGALRCWGSGDHGKLGYANTADVGASTHPFEAGDVSVGGPVRQVALSSENTCALLESGDVRCWGQYNPNLDSGVLGLPDVHENIGDNEHPAAYGPVEVHATREVAAISAGSLHVCALLEDGSVTCWGLGVTGALGNDSGENVGDDETPAEGGVIDLGAGEAATELALGHQYTCAIMGGGGVRCWGDASAGQLGRGSIEYVGVGGIQVSDLVDIPFEPAPLVATTVTAGYQTACARFEHGGARCWGSNFRGQVGLGDSSGDNFLIGDAPGEVEALADIDLGQGVSLRQIAAGERHTCALDEAGAVHCWGQGHGGVNGLGLEATIGDDEPIAGMSGPLELGGAALALTAGDYHTCALMETRTVRCWGHGAYGRLGYASEEDVGDDETPASVGDVLVEAP